MKSSCGDSEGNHIRDPMGTYGVAWRRTRNVLCVGVFGCVDEVKEPREEDAANYSCNLSSNGSLIQFQGIFPSSVIRSLCSRSALAKLAAVEAAAAAAERDRPWEVRLHGRK